MNITRHSLAETYNLNKMFEYSLRHSHKHPTFQLSAKNNARDI